MISPSLRALCALCALCGILFLLGCGDKENSAHQPEKAPPSAEQPIVAAVGDSPIKLSTLQAVATREGLDLYDESARAMAVDEAINFEVLAAEAEANGYFDDPEITRIVKKMAVGKLLRDRLDTPAADVPKPTEAKLRAYYDAHADDFSQPALLKAQMLLVPADKSDAAQQTIADIGDKPFGNLIAEHSSDPAARANGGMSNWIIQDRPNKRYPTELTDALFAAEPDTVVGPIESPQGTWFAKLAEMRPGRTTSFDEAQGRIAQEIIRSKRKAAYAELIKGLRTNAKIEQFPERLESALEQSAKSSGPPPGPPGTR